MIPKRGIFATTFAVTVTKSTQTYHKTGGVVQNATEFLSIKDALVCAKSIPKGNCTCEESIDVDNARKQSIYGYTKETTSVVKSIATCVNISLIKI